ncbi:MAG: acyl carrier protein [Clostridiales bacterium]|nr:acyl carrier protein [Clostridiales bacterium]
MFFEKVRELLSKQFEISEDQITMDTSIIDDLGADSLDVVELIMSLEEEFNIVISEEAAAGITTVREVVEFLEKNVD